MESENKTIYLDEAFGHGKGAFETIKVIKGEARLLKDHLDRLNNTLKFLTIDKKIEEDLVLDFIAKEKEKDFALNIKVSDLNTLISKREDRYKKLPILERKWKLKLSEVRRNTSSKLVKHKTFNYYENIMELEKAHLDSCDEVLFLNEKKQVAEGAISNIFFIEGDRLYTPSLDSGLLPGVMRKFIVEKFDAIEKEIDFDKIRAYDSCFISNSLMGISPVIEIEDIKFFPNDKLAEIIGVFESLSY